MSSSPSVVPETPSNPGVPTAVPETPSDPDVRTVVPESPSSSDLTLESEEKPGKNDESVTSTCSDWFNTTREEMVLYEKFGENYDDVVNQMSHAEKEKLKEEVKNTKAKTEEELMALAGVITKTRFSCFNFQHISLIKTRSDQFYHDERLTYMTRFAFFT